MRVRARRPRRLWATVLGSFLGALSGFVIYWVGAAVVAVRDLMVLPTHAVAVEFARPLHTFTYWEFVVVAIGFLVGAAIGRYRWRLPGVLGFVAMLCLIGGYLAYAVSFSIPQVPAKQRWLSVLLFSAEAAGLSLVAMSAFYSLDVATRRQWDRSPEKRPWDPDHQPKVACQVPVFNEPPEMVAQTIARLMRQDYPKDRFLVLVCDDSTDEEARGRLAAYCRSVGAVHVTRPHRTGFKAGALNHATSLLPKDYDLVAVIDADYWVRPDFLRSIVGHFIDPSIGFIQTPQDYRNEEESFLTRQYKRAEAYFYHAMMPSRNEENAIIFCGTMGIIRRDALDEIGGFAEDQICEDAEVSVRLVAAGWDSLYIDRSFGHGLMPSTFEAYKKQFHRWAFGNVKILFTHWRMILRSRMRRRQKVDFLVSNMHWFDGLFVSIIAGVLLYLGLGPVLGYEGVTHHQHELVLLALIPAFLLVDSIIRLHIVLGRAGHMRLRDAILVQGMWFAIKFTNLTAVLKCMLGRKAPFVRTPKDPGGRLSPPRALLRAIRVTKFESLVGAVMLTVAVLSAIELWGGPPGKFIISGWLVLYGMFFLCAPIYAYCSYRTIRPMRYAGIPGGVEFQLVADGGAYPQGDGGASQSKTRRIAGEA